MAWQRVGPCWRDLRLLRLEVDLHRYSVLTAERIVREKVAEAWANGFGEVVIRHGSSTASRLGTQSIRGRLYELLDGGELNRFLKQHGGRAVYSGHEGHTELELSENPRPRFPRSVRPLPSAEYPGGRDQQPPPDDALPLGRGWSG